MLKQVQHDETLGADPHSQAGTSLFTIDTIAFALDAQERFRLATHALVAEQLSIARA
jgi:hypothetical protein